ncbi:MAG: hypothetical protein GF344_05595 [Chitinivibrionales bacterium]|nr:hypothetical protein [Chitinivibrionales bacterium]
MRFRRFLLPAVLLLMFCSAGSEESPSFGNSLLDILVSKRFYEEASGEEVQSLLSQISAVNPQKRTEAYFWFCNNRRTFRRLILNELARHCSAELVPWLQANKDSLSEHELIGLAQSQSLEETKCVDTALYAFFVDQLAAKKLAYGPEAQIISALMFNSDFHSAQRLHALFRQDTSRWSPRRIVLVTARFDFPEGNALLKDRVSKSATPTLISDCKEYNRHDFLPELKDLHKRLSANPDPALIDEGDDPAKVLKALETVIPYLEQKKKEGVAPGLPKDWPEGAF